MNSFRLASALTKRTQANIARGFSKGPIPTSTSMTGEVVVSIAFLRLVEFVISHFQSFNTCATVVDGIKVVGVDHLTVRNQW